MPRYKRLCDPNMVMDLIKICHGWRHIINIIHPNKTNKHREKMHFCMSIVLS